MSMGGMVRSLAFVGLLVSVGCGRRSEQPAACVPNATASCACRGAPNGVQTCQSNGTFGACECAPAVVARVDDPDKPPPVVAPSETPVAVAEPAARPPSGSAVAPTGNLASLQDRLEAQLRERSADVQSCYERGSESNPALAGRLTIFYTVTPNGRTTEVSTRGLPEAPAVGECVGNLVRGMTFRGPPPSTMTLIYQWTFRPRATDPPPTAADSPETPSRADVAAAMRAVGPAVSACGTGAGGTATVTIAFNNQGRAITASVAPPFEGTPVGSCIARAVRDAHVPPFTRPTFAVTFPFALN